MSLRLFILLAINAFAIIQGAAQATFSTFLERSNFPESEITSLNLLAVDIQSELKEDINKENKRIASAINLDIDLLSEGYFLAEKNETLIYGILLKDENLKGLSVGMRNLNLSKNAKVFIRDLAEQRTDSVWPLRESGNNILSRLYSGSEIYIEIHIPANEIRLSRVVLNKVFQLFDKSYADNPLTKSINTGFGSSSTCQVNAACGVANPYPNTKKSVVRIMMVLEEGLGFCSGSLMNNTADDRTPYILTAFHCQTGFTPIYDMWRFDFEYESIDCSNPSSEPNYLFTTGCSYRAGRDLSDFMLLELDNILPSSVDVYYNGWDHTDNYIPDNVAMFHHPSGDIKKVSIDYDPIVIHPVQINWTGGLQTPPGYHYKTLYDVGTQQSGSSGSPLVDAAERVIGQLHGGFTDTACSNVLGYYGRLNRSWDLGSTPDTRLEDWLDPLNTGVMQFDGRDNTAEDTEVSGTILTATNEPVSGVELAISSGGVNYSAISNDFGEFTVSLQNVSSEILILPSKNSNPGNGVTAIDIIKLRRHILGLEPLDSPEKLLSADVNANGSISAIDLFNVQQLILGKINVMPNGVPSWLFLPASQVIDLGQNSSDLNFKGVKVGDVNLSADAKL